MPTQPIKAHNFTECKPILLDATVKLRTALKTFIVLISKSVEALVISWVADWAALYTSGTGPMVRIPLRKT